MPKFVIILLIAMFFETTGILYLSKGLKQLEGIQKVTPAEVVKLVGRLIQNPNIILGVALQAVFFGLLLYLMAKSDVSFIWPMTSLSFVFATLAARFILHEQVAPLRWAGVCLIMCGAGLITYTEKMKQRAAIANTQPSLAGKTIND
ncbi:MAG: EamA family transporter [Verrucomicrobiales bacterium]